MTHFAFGTQPIGAIEASYVAGLAPASGGATTHNFTGVSFGAEAPDREVFIVIAGTRGSFLDATLVSATIGGVAATIGTPTSSAATVNANCWICWATVPTGSGGNISLTFSASVNNPSAAVYRVTGRPTLGAGHTDFASQADAGPDVTSVTAGLDVAAGGFALGVFWKGSSGPTLIGISSPHLSWAIDANLDSTGSGVWIGFGHSPPGAGASGESVTWGLSGNASSRLTAIWSFS